VDLNLFEFDYDLTFMVFFLNAEGKVYARYGGRDARDADNRQSLAGLDYTMKSVLQMHDRAEKLFAPRSQASSRTIGEVSGARFGKCMHCHQVREALNGELRRNGQWSRDLTWRYPLPENTGMTLHVDRGNAIKEVKDKSPASVAGLKAGDVLLKLGDVPIHSFADVQYALDRSPKAGQVEVVWQRDNKVMKEKLTLADGWRKTDLSWRPSMRRMIPSSRMYGIDLKPAEKKALGLAEHLLAFRQQQKLSAKAKETGIRAGDIILGIDDQALEMDVDGFQRHVECNYLIGDRVTVNLMRDGKRMNLPMTLGR
jgi:S1-C subfamily serine protease